MNAGIDKLPKVERPYMLATLLVVMACSTNVADADTYQTAGRLYNVLEKLVRRHEPGNTKLAREDAARKLRDDVKLTCSEFRLKFRAKIRTVDWQADVLSITTEHTIGLPYDSKARLKVTRHTPIKVKATRESALRIEPGQFVEFAGTVVFVPSGNEYLKESEKAGQIVFTVSVDTWTAGYFKSNDFTLSVNRTRLSAR